MKLNALHRSTVVLCTLAAILALALPAAAQEQRELVTELIKVTNVSLQSAYTLAEGVCRSAGTRTITRDQGQETVLNCFNVDILENERMLTVTATPQVIAGIRDLLADFDRLPLTRTFQIVLLSADRSGSSATDVPQNVRAALEDVRDFLPYTGFSVLGTGWLRSSSEASTRLPGPMEFDAAIGFRPSSDPAAPILIERFSVARLIPATYTPNGEVSSAAQWSNVLGSTFTINPGETVVVGTSKLDGDDTALVVLLTAVQD